MRILRNAWRGFGSRESEKPGRAWLLGSLIWIAVATNGSFAARDGAEDCEVNLTCGRATKAALEHEPSRGPNLANWSLVADQPEAGLLRVAADPVQRSFRDPVTGMELVLVPGACYRTEGLADRPDEVCLDPFYIGVYEVTFDEYDRFARDTGRELPYDEGWGRGRRPVIHVNLYDALNFAKWLSRRANTHYRLPTEVEWEHAARAGTMTRFPWGDELGSNRANCVGCGSQWDDERTAPVGSFAPNAWGLYDVTGNVGEWTCSMRDPDPAYSFERCDSIYETRRRAYRNGAWSDRPDRLRTSARDWNVAMRRSDDVGFRLLHECRACKARTLELKKQRVVQKNGLKAE